jgi:hypothetical protein
VTEERNAMSNIASPTDTSEDPEDPPALEVPVVDIRRVHDDALVDAVTVIALACQVPPVLEVFPEACVPGAAP